MIVQNAGVVVVGGGVMGSATAYQLARDGHKVTVLEQYAAGHSLGSSHGPSRMIRIAYESADYVTLGRAAYEHWRELEAESGQELMVRTGGLDLGTAETESINGIRDVFRSTGVEFEDLDRDEIQRRYPQFSLPDGMIGLFQPDYSLLAADRCEQTMTNLAIAHGASFHYGTAVQSVRPSGDGVEVVTSAGTFFADRVVLAAGSWMAPLLRPLGINLPLTVLKEQLAYFAVRHPDWFLPGTFPLVIHRFPGTTSIGSFFSTYGHAGVKVMIDRIGPAVDPADVDRSINAASLNRLRAYASGLVPDITGEIIETLSCRYTMTPDEDFVIDRHPEHPQIVIASPCSGHGFKFAITLGKILADLAITGSTPYDIDRFRLDRPALASA